MSSRIFGQARKQGLVYDMGSYLNNEWHNAAWDFDGEVNAENAQALFDLIHQELEKVINGEIRDDDIEAAKSYATGRYQMGAQTVSQISDYYSDSYFSTNAIEKYSKMPSLIKNITKDEIVNVAQAFLTSEIKAMVAVSSVEKALINELAKQLEFN